MQDRRGITKMEGVLQKMEGVLHKMEKGMGIQWSMKRVLKENLITRREED